MIIQLGPWEPDSAGVDMPSLAVARNVYPSKTGYGPVPSLHEITTSALPDKCLGLFRGRTTSGGWIIFAGTAVALYRYLAGAWVDYTRVAGGAYGVPDGDFWSFTQFGSLVIATNITDDVQVIDIDTGAVNFSALAGSPPKARYVTVVGDFVILACLAANNRKIRNSAINSAVGWTVGTGLCDEQEFGDGGRVTGVAGGEFGYVTQETSIRRMIFQPGSDLAFRFERIEQEHGATAPYGLISNANAIFFPSNDGFYVYDGTLRPIGSQRVNRWFRSNSDTARFFSVVGFTDPYAPRVYWAFHNATGSTNFDRVLCYDWQLDRWSYLEQEAMYWTALVTAGVTLEELDVYGSIDTGVPYSLDSRVWEGGAPVIAAVTSAGRLAFLEGTTPLTATLKTSPMHLAGNSRAMVTEINPLGVFNGATLGIRVGRREHSGAAMSYTASVSPSTRTNKAPFHAAGREHETELTLTQPAATTAWDHAQGFDVVAGPDGAI